ncbi:MAG: NADH-quinone oxidoreductase subunit L [Candidatus Omnitrophica bacterium]|nr:NADH-quinone oxidoreductase subunit L [Candidatus Omnitrophota bacterium]
MKKEILLYLIIFAPLLGALMLPFMGRFSSRLRNALALILTLISLASSVLLVPSALSGAPVAIKKLFPLGFNLIFAADGLAVFMAMVSSSISAIIVFYSFGYIKHYDNQDEYYSMVLLFLGAMMGLIFSGNLILMYLFWEMTAFTSWRLIGFFREDAHVLKADKAFLVTCFGAVVMLIGFIMLYQQTGSFDLSVIKESLKGNPLSNLSVFLILIGLFAKSATLPFHTWLPDAGVAPSPVTALLHAAILVKIGVYVYARLFVATFAVGELWHTVVPAIAGISALVAAGAALIDTDLKRIIAYSTISQIGFIFLGFAVGTNIGIAGALLFILMHGLAKAGLFLCAGIVEQNTKIKDITKLGGLIKTMPVTAAAFLFCAFSVMGIPPFGGFFAKYMVITASLLSGHIFIALLFLLCSLFTILYLFRAFNAVFLGEMKTQAAKEGSPVMVICVSLLAFLSLAGGILIQYPNSFVQAVVNQIAAVVK